MTFSLIKILKQIETQATHRNLQLLYKTSKTAKLRSKPAPLAQGACADTHAITTSGHYAQNNSNLP